MIIQRLIILAISIFMLSACDADTSNGTAISKSPLIDTSNKPEIFIEGCHLDQPIPSKNGWYAILESKDDHSSIIIAAKLNTAKHLAGVDELNNYCVSVDGVNSVLDLKKGLVPESKWNRLIPLISGLNLTPGPIPKAQYSSNKFKEFSEMGSLSGDSLPKTNETKEIRLGSKVYFLNQSTDVDNGIQKLVLKQGKVSDTILDVKKGNYEGGTGFYIIWAGDLDGDGNLDMFVNAPDHYATPFYLRLYLSSRATKGHLVKQVAERIFSGP